MTEARPVQRQFGEDAGPSRTGISGQRDAYATPNRVLLLISFVLVLNLISIFGVGAAASLKFGGVAFSPGSTVQANVPLSALAKSYAGQGGNPVPPYAVAVLATPVNFDPTKSWPVVIPCSTSDFKRQNRSDLTQFYQRVGLAEGWIRIESRPWSNSTPSWVRSSEPALSGFESELFVAAMRSMTRKPRLHCIGFANWGNSNWLHCPRGSSVACARLAFTKVRLLGLARVTAEISRAI